ncbi:hypothetical protein CKY39_08040 [Variovorax boronicumulans]|uniref:DUF3987 domain-containing protein n=1 Tax=Variovorax boronicumulans TaxID=436515 RepID=A0A250DFL5_9BURK|nr:hypothetical protein CKY39_08040 [Variovorax boronicumulans]
MHSPQSDEKLPISAYGKCLAPAIQEHSSNTKIPMEMIAPVALAAMASAAQNQYNVERPGMAPSPISLNVILIAGSGEGKDASANALLRPFHDFEQKAADAAREARVDLAVATKLWEMQRKAVEAKYRGDLGNRRIADRAARELKKLYLAQPKGATIPKLLFNDATPLAVKQSLCLRWPSALLYSMEASSFFKGGLMRDMAFWNDLWGGAPLHLDRANNHERVSVAAPRMSMILGIQPGMLERFMQRRGREAEDSGLINRFLWASPPPSSGNRWIEEAEPQKKHLAAYAKRCTQLLEDGAKLTGGIDDRRTSLTLSLNAQRVFREAFNEAQWGIRWGPFHEVSGFAAKLTEQATRVAAVLHVADGLDGPITTETLEHAIQIVRWHARQYLRLISPESAQDRCTQDAAEMQRRLHDLRMASQPLVTLKDLQFLFLEASWTRLRIERALNSLTQKGLVISHPIGRTTRYRLFDSPIPASASEMPVGSKGKASEAL